MTERRRTYNDDLRPLPSGAEFVRAVREIMGENEAKMERARANGRGYYEDPSATAVAVARRLRIEPQRRLGNGAKKGSWSGTMSPATRAASRLAALARRGLLVRFMRDEEYRWGYEVARGPSPEPAARLRRREMEMIG